MTRFAWVLNLDAELELAQRVSRYVPRVKLLEQLAQHGQGSRAVLGAHDVLIGPGASSLAGYVGRCWCPTPLALEKLREAGAAPEAHPTPDVLRRVNHRLFAHELGGGLPEQRWSTDRATIEALLRRGERAWLLKRPLAFAGRGQMRFYGPISDKQWSWLDVSLAQDGVIIEPLVTPTLEVSLHGFVWRSGRSELGWVCVQDVSERGVFRGVRLAEAGELASAEHGALFERATHVAAQLHEAGYFGPFGIDGYRYDGPEKSGFCALSEINARYTMSFVTGFPRHPSELSLDE